MQTYDVDNVALTSAFNNHINNAERYVDYRVFVDWDRDGFGAVGSLDDISKYVIDITTDRALTTDLPAQSRITEGAAAATCQITVGGDPDNPETTASILWGAYSKTSPFYGLSRVGAPVQVQVGLPSTFDSNGVPTAWQYVYHFTGRIRGKPRTTANGNVQFALVDGSEGLHGHTPLPMVLAGDAFGIEDARYGLNTQWIVDYILRRNGIYASPPPTDDTVCSITMHGSLYPEIGTPIAARIYPFGSPIAALESPPFIKGLFGLACTSSKPDGSSVTPSVEVEPVGTPVVDGTTGGIQIELVQSVAASYSGSGTFSLQSISFGTSDGEGHYLLLMDDGTLQVWLGVGAIAKVVGPSVASGTAAWKYLGAHIKFNSTTSVTVTFNVSGVTTAVTQTLSESWAAGTEWIACQAEVNAAMESLMFKWRRTPDFGWMPFIPTALLDPGLNKLRVCPYDPTGSDDWATLTDLAAAELAFIGFNEAGLFTFYNRNHRNAPYSYTSPAQNFLYGTTLVKDVNEDENVDGVVNHVTATATPYTVQEGSWVWTLADPTRVPANTTITLWLSFQSSVYGTPNGALFLPGGDPDPTAGAWQHNYYRASTTRNGKGEAVDNLIVTVTPFIDSAKVTIRNPNHGKDAWLVHPSRYPDGTALANQSLIGQPCLLIWGRSVLDSAAGATDVVSSTVTNGASGSVGTTQNEADATSIARYGEQIYDVPTSKWLQDPRATRDVVLAILGDLARPIPQLPEMAIAMDPRFQLQDLVGLITEAWDGINATGKLVAINTVLARGQGAAQSIVMRLMGGPEGWILGDSTWPAASPVHFSQSILGETTILGAKV